MINNDIDVIKIEISGSVATGKSAILQSINKMLMDNNYCVAIPDREERHNPADSLDVAAAHERPNKDCTVIVLVEKLI